jgi:hypothetical protein
LLKGCRCRAGKLHDKTPGANVAAELLAKQVFHVGFVIDHKNVSAQPSRSPQQVPMLNARLILVQPARSKCALLHRVRKLSCSAPPLIVSHDVERVFADIDADHRDCAVGLLNMACSVSSLPQASFYREAGVGAKFRLSVMFVPFMGPTDDLCDRKHIKGETWQNRQ